MRIILDGKTVYVTVSRRNLLTLLHKLDHGVEGGPSACTIWTRNWAIQSPEGPAEVFDRALYLTVEEDEQHYGERTPGEMHPDTEAGLTPGSSPDTA